MIFFTRQTVLDGFWRICRNGIFVVWIVRYGRIDQIDAVRYEKRKCRCPPEPTHQRKRFKNPRWRSCQSEGQGRTGMRRSGKPFPLQRVFGYVSLQSRSARQYHESPDRSRLRVYFPIRVSEGGRAQEIRRSTRHDSSLAQYHGRNLSFQYRRYCFLRPM